MSSGGPVVLPLCPGKLPKRFGRINATASAPDDEFGHVYAPAADFTSMHPPLSLADAIA